MKSLKNGLNNRELLVPKVDNLKLKAKAKVAVKRRRQEQKEEDLFSKVLGSIKQPKDGERGRDGKDAPSLEEILKHIPKQELPDIQGQLEEMYNKIQEEAMAEKNILAEALNNIAIELSKSKQDISTMKSYLSVISQNSERTEQGFTFEVTRDSRGFIKEVKAEPKGK